MDEREWRARARAISFFFLSQVGKVQEERKKEIKKGCESGEVGEHRRLA